MKKDQIIPYRIQLYNYHLIVYYIKKHKFERRSLWEGVEKRV